MDSKYNLSTDEKIQIFKHIVESLDELFTYNPVFFDSGEPVWPYIRYRILAEIFQDIFNLSVPHFSINKSSYIVQLMKQMPQLWKYLTLMIFQRKQFPILFFTTARGRVIFSHGKYFNKYSDYFVEMYKNITAVVEASFRGRYYLPPHVEHFMIYDFLKISYVIKGHLFSVHKRMNRVVKDTLDRLYRVFLIREFLQRISKWLSSVIESYNLYIPFALREFEKFLKKTKPNVVFVHCGSYGGMESTLIKVAKNIGSTVGEFQHGVITHMHPAYNYGTAIFGDKEYKLHLPDYLLVYGDYWKENINFPNKIITVGNPHFWYNYNARKSKAGCEKNPNAILIVSQGSLTELYVKIAKELSKKLGKGYKIIFKLHPGEVPFIERYKELYGLENVEVVEKGDIYNYLCKVRYVISVYSTTIYEAIALGNTVFVFKHPLSEIYVPKDLGKWVESTEEIVELVKHGFEDTKKYDLNYYFDSNWKKNYRKFIEEIIGIPG